MDSAGDKVLLDPCFLRYLKFIQEKKQQMMKCSSAGYDIPFIKSEVKSEPVSSECEVSEEYSDYSSDNFKNEDSEGSSSYSSMFSTKKEPQPLNLLVKTELKDKEDEVNNDEDEPDFCVQDHLTVSCDIKEEMTFEENEIASSCGYESDFSNPYDGPINLSLKKWDESSSDMDAESSHIEHDFMKFLQEQTPERFIDVGIPMTVDDIIHLPLTTFRDRLSKCNLTSAQIRMLKDLRRRGKNRMYSQNSRRKRTNHILKLKQDLNAVRVCKAKLFLERQCILAKREALEKKFMQLYFLIFKECAFNDREFIPVSGEHLISAIANQKNSVISDLNVNIIDVDENEDNDCSNVVSRNHDQTVPASFRNLLGNIPSDVLMEGCGISSSAKNGSCKKRNKILLNKRKMSNKYFHNFSCTGKSFVCNNGKKPSDVPLQIFEQEHNTSNKSEDISTHDIDKEVSDIEERNVGFREESDVVDETNLPCNSVSKIVCGDNHDMQENIDTGVNEEERTEAVDLRVCCEQNVSEMFATKIRSMINEANTSPMVVDCAGSSNENDDNPVNESYHANGDNPTTEDDNHSVDAHPINQNDHSINEDVDPINEDVNPINEEANPINEEGKPVNEEGKPVNEEGKPINEELNVNTSGDVDEISKRRCRESESLKNQAEYFILNLLF